MVRDDDGSDGGETNDNATEEDEKRNNDNDNDDSETSARTERKRKNVCINLEAAPPTPSPPLRKNKRGRISGSLTNLAEEEKKNDDDGHDDVRAIVKINGNNDNSSNARTAKNTNNGNDNLTMRSAPSSSNSLKHEGTLKQEHEGNSKGNAMKINDSNDNDNSSHDDFRETRDFFNKLKQKGNHRIPTSTHKSSTVVKERQEGPVIKNNSNNNNNNSVNGMNGWNFGIPPPPGNGNGLNLKMTSSNRLKKHELVHEGSSKSASDEIARQYNHSSQPEQLNNLGKQQGDRKPNKSSSGKNNNNFDGTKMPLPNGTNFQGGPKILKSMHHQSSMESNDDSVSMNDDNFVDILKMSPSESNNLIKQHEHGGNNNLKSSTLKSPIKSVTDSDAEHSSNNYHDDKMTKVPFNGVKHHQGGLINSMTSKSLIKSSGSSLSSSSMQTVQTLVFPRLPSNDCPGYRVFAPPPCLPCRDTPAGTCAWNSKNNNNNTTNETTLPMMPTAVQPPEYFTKLNTNNNNNNDNARYEEYALSIRSRGGSRNRHVPGNASTFAHTPLPLEGAHPRRPKSGSLIFLKSALVMEDEPSLAHVPYFEDGDNEDIYTDLFDTVERERLYEFGPKYQEEETLETVDMVLRLMAAQEPKLFESVELYEEATEMPVADDGADEKVIAKNSSGSTNLQSDVQKLERIHLVLSELAEVDLERVHERHHLCFLKGESSDKPSEATGMDKEDNNNGKKASAVAAPAPSCFFVKPAMAAAAAASSSSPKKNSETRTAVPYESIMDSYRDLLCRRCFTYDCNIHGNLPKANLDLLGELAVQKEVDGHWKELDKDVASDFNDEGKPEMNTSQNGKVEDDINTAQNSEAKDNIIISKNNDKQKAHSMEELTPAQQSVCKHTYLIFQGDTAKIAHAISANQSAVDAYVKSQKIELPQKNKYVTTQYLNKRKGKKERLNASMKNYNPKWLRHIQSKVIHPAFLPCDHGEPCNNNTCSCVQNGFFCTKHCGWGSKSPNYFRGCECKAGMCRKISCPCYAAKRECDPDLCRTCGACTDPADAPATGDGQRCRNDNISMYRHAHLLIAESSIKQAGWGLFTKHSLKKGDFVHEYVGEVISQEEAERRGVIYDKLNMSYLFNLTSDLVVDASRKGNKARYANHSSTPNIEPKMIHANGDTRIGFFAKHDIDAQSELFFDYRYDDQMDNDLIFKPDHSVNFDWMNKNNNQAKKKNS